MAGKLLEDFPPVTTERWKAAITKDLKGADYDKKLLWRSEDGITVKPFYCTEDLNGIANLDSAPGEFPYLRGTRSANTWRIRERVEDADPRGANLKARKALAAGAEEIVFSGLKLASAKDLLLVVEALDCAVHFEAGKRGREVLGFIAEALGRVKFEGSLEYDPHRDGIEPSDIDPMLQLVKRIVTTAPGFRPITVRASALHDSGATIVQELGYALAAGVDYMAGLTERGLTVDQAASALAFSFASGSNFFFEIAKLRAARVLWAQAVAPFKPANPDSAKAQIHARGARWNKTIYDAHVNILRGTTEAMSGAIGGCDSIEVTPFDECYRHADEFSRHIARNTQIILKKESWLDRSVDAAGGSYYVETLTDSLAREAWKLMQEVEKAGGFHKAWAQGSIAQQVAASRQAKEAAVASRRRSILGTNQYPNRDEKALERIERKGDDAVTPRAAEVFERLRLRTERHAKKTGRVPLFLLAETGDLKMRKARSAFSANFFGCAGFAVQAETFADAAAIAKGAAAAKADAIVLCSSDEEYPALAPAVTAATKTPVIVAGFPKDAVDALKKAGVADFVHIRANAAEVLAVWQTKLGMEA